MRIVLNTRSDDAGSRVCVVELGARLRAAGAEATVGDWGRYDRYDVAVFMGYDHELEEARRQNPRIRVVLADPKLSRPDRAAAARAADLLLVSSVEQREAFLSLNRNVHVHFMFPDVPSYERRHDEHEPVVIAYHGNRAHLESLVTGAKPALEALAALRRIEFVAVYNVAGLGRARLGMPEALGLTVRHVQWTPAFHEELARADIGIVPTELPVRDRLDALERTAFPEPALGYEPFDHLVRFKASANPGRIFPFARAGVPVVCDFAPSVGQLVRDGESGFVVSSPHGWFEALDALAASPNLRQRLADALRRTVEDAYERQVPAFLDALRANPKPQLTSPGRELDEAAARLSRYPVFRAPLWRRLAARARAAVLR